MPTRSAASRASLSRSASSVSLRSVMFLAIPMIPCGRPAVSVTWRTWASIQTREPSLRRSRYSPAHSVPAARERICSAIHDRSGSGKRSA